MPFRRAIWCFEDKEVNVVKCVFMLILNAEMSLIRSVLRSLDLLEQQNLETTKFQAASQAQIRHECTRRPPPPRLPGFNWNQILLISLNIVPSGIHVLSSKKNWLKWELKVTQKISSRFHNFQNQKYVSGNSGQLWFLDTYFHSLLWAI